MDDVLGVIVQVAALVFVVSSMLAMGQSLTITQIVAPLKKLRLVVVALVLNFALAPLLVWAIQALLDLDQDIYTGLLIMATAGGAPFLPKLAQAAKGNAAFSVGLMVLLMVVTVAYMPLALPLLLSGVEIDALGHRQLTDLRDAAALGRGPARQGPLVASGRRSAAALVACLVDRHPPDAGRRDHPAVGEHRVADRHRRHHRHHRLPAGPAPRRLPRGRLRSRHEVGDGSRHGAAECVGGARRRCSELPHRPNVLVTIIVAALVGSSCCCRSRLSSGNAPRVAALPISLPRRLPSRLASHASGTAGRPGPPDLAPFRKAKRGPPGRVGSASPICRPDAEPAHRFGHGVVQRELGSRPDPHPLNNGKHAAEQRVLVQDRSCSSRLCGEPTRLERIRSKWGRCGQKEAGAFQGRVGSDETTARQEHEPIARPWTIPDLVLAGAHTARSTRSGLGPSFQAGVSCPPVRPSAIVVKVRSWSRNRCEQGMDVSDRRIGPTVGPYLDDTRFSITPRAAEDVLRQAFLMLATNAAYDFSRTLVKGRQTVAMENGTFFMNLEKSLGMYWEPWIAGADQRRRSAG